MVGCRNHEGFSSGAGSLCHTTVQDGSSSSSGPSWVSQVRLQLPELPGGFAHCLPFDSS